MMGYPPGTWDFSEFETVLVWVSDFQSLPKCSAFQVITRLLMDIGGAMADLDEARGDNEDGGTVPVQSDNDSSEIPVPTHTPPSTRSSARINSVRTKVPSPSSKWVVFDPKVSA